MGTDSTRPAHFGFLRRQHWRSLLLLALLPYLHTKLEKILARQRDEDDFSIRLPQSFVQKLYRAFLAAYPFVCMAWDGWVFCQQLLYVFGKVRTHSPLLWLAGVKLSYLTADDIRTMELKPSGPTLSPSQRWVYQMCHKYILRISKYFTPKWNKTVEYDFYKWLLQYNSVCSFSALGRNFSISSLRWLVVLLYLFQPASRLECFSCSFWSGGIHPKTKAPLSHSPPCQPLHLLFTFITRRLHSHTSKCVRSVGRCAPMTLRLPLQAMCFVTNVFMFMSKPTADVLSPATLLNCNILLKYTHRKNRLVFMYRNNFDNSFKCHANWNHNSDCMMIIAHGSDVLILVLIFNPMMD